MNIAVETMKELSKLDNIVAVKEASGNISQVAKIKQACGDALDIYSGNDDQIIPIMSLGGKGVISVLSNCCPKETHEICALCMEEKYSEAREIAMKTLPFANALFSDVNPIPVKQALNYMGFKAGSCRLPLCDMSDEAAAKLKAEMEKLGLVNSIK